MLLCGGNFANNFPSAVFFCIMGIHEAAPGLQTTKNPNPKRIFPDLEIHEPKGSSLKERLDKKHPWDTAAPLHRKPHTLQVSHKTHFLEIARF